MPDIYDEIFGAPVMDTDEAYEEPQVLQSDYWDNEPEWMQF